jgi:glucokinase
VNSRDLGGARSAFWAGDAARRLLGGWRLGSRIAGRPAGEKRRWLGLDLGGTNIKVAVLSIDDGGTPTVVGLDQRVAEADLGPARVLDNLAAAGAAAIGRYGNVAGAAIGVPGLFDDGAGTIELFPNLPGPWRGQPVVGPLGDALGLPVGIINDARAFTLAESRLGAAAGCQTVAAFVLGTGIGGGIVVDGRLHFGRLGRAGELAHQVIVPDGPPCGCGNRGCLEALAAAGPIIRGAGTATVDDAFAAARAGDERAVATLAQVTDYLGVAIANVITMLVPERVVIGGGIAEAGDALLNPVRAATARHCVLVPPDWYEIVPAVLGPHAGAIGAALWANHKAT